MLSRADVVIGYKSSNESTPQLYDSCECELTNIVSTLIIYFEKNDKIIIIIRIIQTNALPSTCFHKKCNLELMISMICYKFEG